MKNEGMAGAISHIDPLLVEEAGKAGQKERIPGKRKLFYGLFAAAAGLAACGVILAAVRGAVLKNSITVMLYGQEVSSSPATVEMPAAASAVRSVFADVTVPLLVETEAGVTAVAEEGILEIPDKEAGEEGKKLEFSGDVKLIWTVEQARPGSVYRLKIGDSEICLSYSDSDGCWTVYKK